MRISSSRSNPIGLLKTKLFKVVQPINFYQKELSALEQKGLLRQRTLYNEDIIDFASNHYLGFSEDKDILHKAYAKVRGLKTHSPKASLLVNGYSPVHKEFEDNLKKHNDFEDCILVGSCFLANIALIESLVRKKDLLFIDSEFHASGMLASRLLPSQKMVFRHNDFLHLEELLKANPCQRAIVAIEGIYSMSGDICCVEFFELAKKYNVILIIDEAHSSGVIGEQCLGVMNYYNIAPSSNIIKMGTLGKAFGSYGAYILASHDIICFLQNRAKSIVYSTAISLFDIALANEAFIKMRENTTQTQSSIRNIQNTIQASLDIKKQGLIFPIEIGDNKKVLQLQEQILAQNMLIGAIREPTVPKAILRIIGSVANERFVPSLCENIKKLNA